MRLDFRVKEQVISCENGRAVVENTRGVVYAAFEFDEEWDGCGIAVIFTNENCAGEPVPMVWMNEPMEIPAEVLVNGRLKISCVGTKDDGQYQINTYEMKTGIMVYRSGEMLGFVTDEITPSMIEQLLAAAGVALTAAEDAHAAADTASEAAGRASQATANANAVAAALVEAKENGEFKGDKGDKGDPGSIRLPVLDDNGYLTFPTED